MMKKVDLEIMLKREEGHREVRQTFQQNHVPKLIKTCNEKVKKVRMSAANKETSKNFMCCVDKVIMKGGQIEFLLVKELI